MPRWFVGLGLGICATVAFACNDELVEDVAKDVCYSEKRWIGGKRGSPEMYPGRDCVGCHLDNDGPPLAIGGTLYPFVLNPRDTYFAAQSGEDCFGEEGRVVTITDFDGQTYELTTNRAGNFYVEGNPDDFAKPFSVEINWLNEEGDTSRNLMVTQPMYGGCARCHNPNVPTVGEAGLEFTTEPADAEYRNGQAFVGLVGNVPVDEEIRSFIDAP